jgi:signal transduction histidine kinase
MPMRHDQLAQLASYLAQRRDAIMEAWRTKVTIDPKLTTGTSLPRAQLHDHLPALLQDFERRLVAGDSQSRAAAVDEQKGDAAAHGLHRWQQGFDLSEVSRELGRLNECVVGELDSCAIVRPEIEHSVMAEARKIWAALYSVAIGSSISRYFELQQLEAAGHVADLEHALHSLRELEVQRAELWQQAAHDLRGNLGVVVMATAGLTSVNASGEEREKFLGSLDRNVRALHRLLEDVTSLARLQSGQELRALAQLDASRLLRDLAESVQAMADERNLLLTFDGPETLMVEGDAIKTQRIVQNLVFNAVKYTRQGGVSVSWGPSGEADADRWFVEVKDTGPGFHAGPGAPLAGALGVATDQAKDVVTDEASGDVTHVEPAQSGVPLAPIDTRTAHQQAGEGIGLSIVKRLCGLLDATIEVDSKIGEGTDFRVLLPRQYPR